MEPNVEPTIRITLRLPESLHTTIQRLAEQQDRSLNGQIIRLLKLGAGQEDTIEPLQPKDRAL